MIAKFYWGIRRLFVKDNKCCACLEIVKPGSLMVGKVFKILKIDVCVSCFSDVYGLDLKNL